MITPAQRGEPVTPLHAVDAGERSDAGSGRLPEVALKVLLGAAVVLTVASLAARVADRIWRSDGVLRFFDVDAEANLPTWYGASLLLAAAVLLVVVAVSPIKDKPARWYWVLLSAVFVALSVDEAARLHEALGEELRRTFDLGGVLRYAWVIPYGVAMLVLLGVLVPFLRALPERQRKLFLWAGALFVLGAAGVNAVIGVLVEGDPAEGLISGLGHLEEFMEMTGLAVFIYALLDYISVSRMWSAGGKP